MAAHWDEVKTLSDVPMWLGGMGLRGFLFVGFGHIYGLPFLLAALAVNLIVFGRPAAPGGVSSAA